jgi:hypothetical protein
LDKFLVSREWELLFPLTIVDKLIREVYDHNPIILDTMEGREKQAREFRFEKRYLKEVNFLPRVSRIWAQSVKAKDSLALFQLKSKNVKKALKGWGANIRGRYIRKKKDLTQELAGMEMLEEITQELAGMEILKSYVQEELMVIYEHEEEVWRQRWREQWLLQGDNNTEFFHRCANG